MEKNGPNFVILVYVCVCIFIYNGQIKRHLEVKLFDVKMAKTKGIQLIEPFTHFEGLHIFLSCTCCTLKKDCFIQFIIYTILAACVTCTFFSSREMRVPDLPDAHSPSVLLCAA